MRGKDKHHRPYAGRHGITPACAGKRTTGRHWCQPEQDHPRMCGEKPPSKPRSRLLKGSPPHVRGKASKIPQNVHLCRITPACAGKSRSYDFTRRYRRDHPRMCGEKRARLPVRKSGRGSPPHVRGKGPGCGIIALPDGITPACAGKSSIWGNVIYVIWDHPRMCGEKLGAAPCR